MDGMKKYNKTHLMKTLPKNISITILIIITSCESGNISFPKTTFDSPFPKRNINLDKIIGDHLLIKSWLDTLSISISSTRKFNLITNDKTGDTIFLGPICRYRGLYYFNQQLNDSSYWIYAVKITDNLIYGLDTGYDQMLLVDEFIDKGLYPQLVKYQTEDAIRLHPEKRGLKKLFTSIVDSISPDTIINTKETSAFSFENIATGSQIDPEEYELITNVYPNPTRDYINIDLGRNENITYQLINHKSQSVLTGDLTSQKSRIDLLNLPEGIYAMVLQNKKTKQKEVLKIVKVK